MWREHIDVAVLQGQILTKVEKIGDDSILFETATGEKYEMYHEQDCCEHVYIESIVGDLEDLVGSPILMAEEVTNIDEPPTSERGESYTWTFYKFATNKGYVTIRWYGSSNGYYSESVSFSEA